MGDVLEKLPAKVATVSDSFLLPLLSDHSSYHCKQRKLRYLQEPFEEKPLGQRKKKNKGIFVLLS